MNLITALADAVYFIKAHGPVQERLIAGTLLTLDKINATEV
jgi:hypothetical protein